MTLLPWQSASTYCHPLRRSSRTLSVFRQNFSSPLGLWHHRRRTRTGSIRSSHRLARGFTTHYLTCQSRRRFVSFPRCREFRRPRLSGRTLLGRRMTCSHRDGTDAPASGRPPLFRVNLHLGRCREYLLAMSTRQILTIKIFLCVENS